MSVTVSVKTQQHDCHDTNEGSNSDETIQIAPQPVACEENFRPNSPLEVNDFQDIEVAEPYILSSDNDTDSENDAESRHDDGNIFASIKESQTICVFQFK